MMTARPGVTFFEAARTLLALVTFAITLAATALPSITSAIASLLENEIRHRFAVERRKSSCETLQLFGLKVNYKEKKIHMKKKRFSPSLPRSVGGRLRRAFHGFKKKSPPGLAGGD
ncbi:hypothetical protein [Mesorhizobium sp. M1E.F.Ca.ET.063.01.1.1]|uniref:hypothetical protein n=1 Tax=Mesorhizobium sp. M1E.F.Ca.ET.063.01.1.1 TaxID=2496750 RepID=UPI00167AD895|nr:hypothetical protein [Mesorhizobium sp. M1E.F.Ca.ET.063.01.1.1]